MAIGTSIFVHIRVRTYVYNNVVKLHAYNNKKRGCTDFHSYFRPRAPSLSMRHKFHAGLILYTLVLALIERLFTSYGHRRRLKNWLFSLFMAYIVCNLYINLVVKTMYDVRTHISYYITHVLTYEYSHTS